MRAADDFATIWARMRELERERDAPPKHDGMTWRVQRVEEITKVAQEKTRELLRRAWSRPKAAACWCWHGHRTEPTLGNVCTLGGRGALGAGSRCQDRGRSGDVAASGAHPARQGRTGGHAEPGALPPRKGELRRRLRRGVAAREYIRLQTRSAAGHPHARVRTGSVETARLLKKPTRRRTQ